MCHRTVCGLPPPLSCARFLYLAPPPYPWVSTAQANFVGVDLAAGMVEVAKERYPRATFVQVHTPLRMKENYAGRHSKRGIVVVVVVVGFCRDA